MFFQRHHEIDEDVFLIGSCFGSCLFAACLPLSPCYFYGRPLVTKVFSKHYSNKSTFAGDYFQQQINTHLGSCWVFLAAGWFFCLWLLESDTVYILNSVTHWCALRTVAELYGRKKLALLGFDSETTSWSNQLIVGFVCFMIFVDDKKNNEFFCLIL